MSNGVSAQTVSAFSGKQLKAVDLSESNDLGRMIPGLNIGTPAGAGNQPSIFMRGIGLNDFSTNNLGPVGVYVDNLFVSSPSAQVLQVFDLERVEALKGPQGTLYGRNTTGGAIRFLSAKPTNQFKAGVYTQYSSFNTSKIEGYISGPFSDNVRGRIAFVKNDSDGYVTNDFDNSDANGANNISYRALLDADLSENFKLNFGFYGANVNQDAARYRSQGIMDPNDPNLVTPCSEADIIAGNCVNFLGLQNPNDFYHVNQNRASDLIVNSYATELKLSLNLDGVTITSITGYQNLDKRLWSHSFIRF